MLSINGLPKYLYYKEDYTIVFLRRETEIYPYRYFVDTSNTSGSWGSIRDTEVWVRNKRLEPLQLKHILGLKYPIEREKKEVICAFINDLIEEIKTK